MALPNIPHAFGARSRLQQPPQHRLQNPAVAVVLQLDWCIDSARCCKLDRAAFLVGDADLNVLPRLEVVADLDIEGAQAREAEAAAVLASLEDQRQHAHADE